MNKPTLEHLFDMLKQNKGLTLSKTLTPYTGSGYAIVMPNNETTINEIDLDIGTFTNLVKLYQHKLQENQAIGLWIDQTKVFFDITEIVQDVSQAINLGKTRSQIAIFSFNSLETIYIN